MLGTERLSTQSNQYYAADSSSYAFGESYSSYRDDPTLESFAGTQLDPESQTDHAQFRQYSFTHGSWLSPDPYDGSYNTSNPQSFNRYSYVRNNPLLYVGPLGLDADPYSVTVSTDYDEYVDLDEIFWTYGFMFGGGGSSGEGGGGGAGPNNLIHMPLPSNAQVCTTSTGVQFSAPPGFSAANIAANGYANGLAGAKAAVAQGGYYDFQRFQVGTTTQFFSGYTPVANIAVGAYLQGVPGMTTLEGSAISNIYATFKSANGATAVQAQFRNLGFDLASGKVSYSCQPHP